jgi:hypothetical protein
MHPTVAALGGVASVYQKFQVARMRPVMLFGRLLLRLNIRRSSSSLFVIEPSLVEFLDLYSGRRAFGNARLPLQGLGKKFHIAS